MNTKDKIANLLLLYIVTFFCISLFFLYLYGRDVTDAKMYEYIVFCFLLIMAAFFSREYIVFMMRKEITKFIDALHSDNDGIRRNFYEYRVLRHMYQVSKNASQTYKIENLMLKEHSEHYKARIEQLRKEVVSLDHRMDQLEMEIESCEANFVGISNNMNEFVFISDKKGIVTYANNALVDFMPQFSVGDHISGIIQFNEEDCHYFKSFDFENVEVNLWGGGDQKFAVSTKSINFLGEYNNVIYIVENYEKYNLENQLFKRNQGFYFISEIFGILNKENVRMSDIQDFLDKVSIYAGFYSSSIRIIDKETQRLDLYLYYNADAFMINRESVDIYKSHMGLAYTSHLPVCINDRSQLMFPERALSNAVDKGFCVNYFPLRLHEANMGVFCIATKKPMSENSFAILQSIAINLTIALEKIMLYDNIRKDLFAIVNDCGINTFHYYRRRQVVRIAKVCRLIAEYINRRGEDIDAVYSTIVLIPIYKLERRCLYEGAEFLYDDYEEFFDLAKAFDEFFDTEKTLEESLEFIEHYNANTVYSTINLGNVLEYILKTEWQQIVTIYGDHHE